MELYTYDVPAEQFDSIDQLRDEYDHDFFDRFAPSTSAKYRADFSLGFAFGKLNFMRQVSSSTWRVDGKVQLKLWKGALLNLMTSLLRSS